MNWDDIQDGDDAVTLRTRFNNFLNYVAGFISDPDPGEDQSRWEDDGNDITPKNDKDVNVPSLNVAGSLDVGGLLDANELSGANNFRVESDGKVFIDDLAEVNDVPLILGDDGRIKTLTTIDKYTVTINFTFDSTYIPVSISGQVFFSKQNFMDIVSVDGTSVSIDLPDGTYQYIGHFDKYNSISGSITVDGGAVTFNVELSPQFNIEEADVVEGRGSLRKVSGSEDNLTLRRPVAVVERDENYDLTLPNPAEVSTAEMSARKSKSGGALTLNAEGGFVLDDEHGDVLTTTTKGAWVKVKAMEVDGTMRWVIILDSGDWELDSD